MNSTRLHSAVPDARRGNWVDRVAPGWLLPYARLARWDRPIGWQLLLFPCWWSAILAADAMGRAYPDPGHIVLFLVGAIAMRGAGCTINDIIDRDLDAAVGRTRARPIPSGQVTVRQALVFLALQCLAGLLVLLAFNGFTIVLALAVLPVVAIYPFLKRVTNWPQLGLGLAFSWGALVGWSAAVGGLDWVPVLLYAGCVLWTIGYDTIYALQDREDDALVGIRSTARLFGDRVVPAVAVAYGGALLLWAGAFWAAGAGVAAYVGLAAVAALLAWQVRQLDFGRTENALRLFRANRIVGVALAIGLLVDAVVTSAA